MNDSKRGQCGCRSVLQPGKNGCCSTSSCGWYAEGGALQPQTKKVDRHRDLWLGADMAGEDGRMTRRKCWSSVRKRKNEIFGAATNTCMHERVSAAPCPHHIRKSIITCVLSQSQAERYSYSATSTFTSSAAPSDGNNSASMQSFWKRNEPEICNEIACKLAVGTLLLD